MFSWSCFLTNVRIDCDSGYKLGRCMFRVVKWCSYLMTLCPEQLSGPGQHISWCCWQPRTLWAICWLLYLRQNVLAELCSRAWAVGTKSSLSLQICHKEVVAVIATSFFFLLLPAPGTDDSGLLVHCISGWDRTPLFISLLRLSLWAVSTCLTSSVSGADCLDGEWLVTGSGGGAVNIPNVPSDVLSQADRGRWAPRITMRVFSASWIPKF